MNDRKQLKRVLIMAGGTGGHVFPGLALAHHLREQGIEVHWLGTAQGLESRLVPEAAIPLHRIKISGLRGKGLLQKFKAPINISIAMVQALLIIRAIKPDVVVGMGGFVSGPGGLASWLLGYPLVIHEQNAKAGLTNKYLARFAKRILLGFPDAFLATKKNAIMLGNPVRQAISKLPAPKERLSEARSPFHLLILGGSLGAQALNECVPQALALLPQTERPLVLHQTGDKHLSAAKKTYESMRIAADVQPFIEDMAKAYAWADMVLCRAGALTVAELCAVGLGAVFIPYPHAVDDHQTANANFMVSHHAALCIQQKELTAKHLAETMQLFTRSPEKRLEMAMAAYQLRHTDVVEKMIDVLSEVANGKV